MLPTFFSSQTLKAERFFLDLTPAPEVALTVVSGGFECCAPDYDNARLDFPYFGIEYVAAGQGTVAFDGAAQALVPGSLFAYGPGVPHRIRTDPRWPMTKFFVDFYGRESQVLLAQVPLPPGQVRQVLPPDEVRACFDELVRQGQRARPHLQAFCQHLLRALVCLMADGVSGGRAESARAYATFQRCRDYIREHEPELQAAGSVAGVCHVDPAYMCRLFKRFQGQGPHQYLLRLKMLRAAALLQSTGVLVKDVAAALAFADAFQFSRTFKRVYGLAPEAFRRVTQRGQAIPRPRDD